MDTEKVTTRRSRSTGRSKRNASPTASSTPLPFSPKARSPIKAGQSSKSPSRRPKTPMDNKSPARKSPSRKSPSRKSPSRKSPPRKSPTRKQPRRNSPTRNDNLTDAVRRIRKQDSQSDLDADMDLINIEKEKPKARVRGRRRFEDEITTLKQDIKISEVTIPLQDIRRSMRRSTSTNEVERVVHLKNFDNLSKKLGEFSDEDEIIISKSKSVERKYERPKTPTEFGGWLGALILIIITPLSMLWLHLFCNELSCSFTISPNHSKLLSLSTYFHLNSILWYSLYCIFLAFLSILPFGGRKVTGLPNKQGRLIYRMNGLFSCFIIMSIFWGMELKGYGVVDYIIGHMFHLLVASMIIGLYISIHAFIRSFLVPVSQLNSHIIGKNLIYNFFMGREINPRIFGILDMKMYVNRLALIGALLLDTIYLYKSMGGLNLIDDPKSIEINSTMLTMVLLRAIYLFDGLIYESAWITSFEIQYEGFGFISGFGYSIYPFMTVSITKYVLDYGVQLSTLQLILIVIVFLLGYILFRGANNQKDAFRKNPYSPSFSNMETITTTLGRKLLASGFWGIVRHPNYLGDILITLSFAPFALWVPPVLTVYSIVLLLVHRSIRDNERCKQKYGTSWES